MKLKDYIITILLVVCIIVSMVSFYNCKTIIEGKQGEQGIQGETGAAGKDGEKGDSGEQGPAGKDGTTIVNVNIDEKTGHLVFIFNDGTTIDAGNCKGENGEDGKDGTNGKDGKNGTNGTNGTNGKDGISITNTKVINGYLWVYLSNGQSINAGYVKGADGKDGEDGKDGNIDITIDSNEKYNKITFFEDMQYGVTYDYLAIYITRGGSYNGYGRYFAGFCTKNGREVSSDQAPINLSLNGIKEISARSMTEGIYILTSACANQGGYVSFIDRMPLTEFMSSNIE